MKIKLLATTVTFMLSGGAFANSASTEIDMNGSWYQQVDMSNVTASSLGIEPGDDVTITSPRHTMITGTWGTMTLTNCSTSDQEDVAETICRLNNTGTYTNTLSISVSAVGFEGTEAKGSLTIGEVAPASSAIIYIQLPEKPDYVEGDAKAHVTILRDGVSVATVSNEAWGSRVEVPVSFNGDSADYTIEVDDLQNGTGSAEPAQFTLSNNDTKTVVINYEEPAEQQYGSLSVNVSTSGDVPQMQPSYSITDESGVTMTSGSLSQGGNLIENLVSADDGVHYYLNTPSFTENDIVYTTVGGSIHDFSIYPNQTTSLSLIYKGEPISTDLPYPLEALQNQYNNWLIVNTGIDGVIKGGYEAYTSEGIAFQVLIAAGMLELDSGNQDAIDSLESAYNFIYNSDGGSRLLNGLLPWAFDENLNVLEQYSATDADFMFARGFYLAGSILNNSDYIDAAVDMMQALYQYDTTNLNGAVFMNQGGANAGSTRNEPVDGVAGMAYSKTLLSALTEFADQDESNRANWMAIIDNTLDAMVVAQNTAIANNSKWGGVLGFMRQGVPGAAYYRYEDGQFYLNITGDESENTFYHWNLNYDAGRIPLILGEYILEKCAAVSSENCQEAKSILSGEMGSVSGDGINGVFFDYDEPENGYLVYLPEMDGEASYASIFENNQPQDLPDTSSPNAYSDDFLNAVFLMGNLANNGWQGSNANPSTISAIKLIDSASGSYYGGGYKLLVGLALDGAFNNGVPLISSNDYVNNTVSIPAKFDADTRIVLERDGKANGYYYMDYLVQPAVMTAGQHYQVKITASFPNGQKDITRWESQAWGDGSVITLQSQGSNCAIFDIVTNRPDYQTIGLIGLAGSWTTLDDAPVLTYSGQGSNISC